jgi:hypothetical protein
MPLVTSPVGGGPMVQVRRHGVEVDICPKSGGVWLDRGELERLIDCVGEEARAEAVRRGWSGGGVERLDEGRAPHGGGSRSLISNMFDF